MIKNIQAQGNHHSFILIQAYSIQIAQKLPYHVLSANNQLLYSDFDKQNQPNFRYNYTIDCVSYNFSGKNIVLSQGEWLSKYLTESQIDIIKDKRYIYYKNLNISTVTSLHYTQQVLTKQTKQNEKLFFYYYSGEKSRKFIKIIPKIVHYCDCIVFQLPNSYFQTEISLLFQKTQEKLPTPKQIPDNQKLNNIYSHLSKISPNNLLNLKFFHFNSEYSLMSDQHFLNCLVHGKRNICSYVKIQISDKSQYSLSVLKNQNDQSNQKKFRIKEQKKPTNLPDSIFYWWIHPQIYKMLLQVYEKPKL